MNRDNTYSADTQTKCSTALIAVPATGGSNEQKIVWSLMPPQRPYRNDLKRNFVTSSNSARDRNVVVRPTTKQSQATMGNDEIKEENNIFRLLRRKRKTNDKQLIRKNMKASGAFPSPQPVAVSEPGAVIPAAELRKAIRASRSLHDVLLKYAQAFGVQTTHTAICNAHSKIWIRA